MMFCLAIGYAFVHNAHVRLDLFRPRLGRRGRPWVKLLSVLATRADAHSSDTRSPFG